jgi:hypothetical protein
MRFKDFVESGHLNMRSIGSIQVLYRGQVVVLDDVAYIDPRLETMDLPPINPRLKKFLGETDFSLPLADGSWIVSKRRGMMSGDGFVSSVPIGFEVPSDWADYALFMDREGGVVHPEEAAQPVSA